jgi:hypothetical protein
MADNYVSQYALSHDLVRIWAEDDALAAYIYAFLSTPTAQAMLRHRMSGSVVDHLTTQDVAGLEVPLLAEREFDQVAGLVRRSHELIESARSQLDALVTELAERYPAQERQVAGRRGWTVGAGGLTNGQRMDAHFHDPTVEAARQQLRSAGGVPVGEVAEAHLPVRYKRYYVEADHGRPILSGRQVLQIEPVNLRYIADRSFKDPELMRLYEGMVVFGAVGRWEGRLGEPALICTDRDGWLASNDVMRLRPRGDRVDPGWIWLAMASHQVRLQVAALPYGSVIDHTGPHDVEKQVILPPPDNTLGAKARGAWNRYDEARALKQQALDMIERQLPLIQ